MSFELIILGSSSALPTSKRSTAAHLLTMNERFFLIDCGEGTQIQLRKNKLSPARINHIFISHLHGDHVFGLFGLISSMGLMGRLADLHLYGPSGLEDLLQTHLAFFGMPPFQLVFHIAADQEFVYEDSKVCVRALKLKHRKETFGYLFKEKEKPLNIDKATIDKYNLGVEDIRKIKQGNDHQTVDGQIIPNTQLTLPPLVPRSYAYISDTAFLPQIAEKLKGTTLLFHESTFLEKDMELAKDTFHSTAGQAAEIARLAEAETLLIGHFSTRYKEEESFLEEAKKIFPNTIAVNDGDRFSLEPYRQLPTGN